MALSVNHLCDAMEALAPVEWAEPWDRVGLHVGRREDPITGPVLLTIDLTEAVLDEAIGMGASAIVAYHPPIWNPLERVTDATVTERIVHAAIRAGIAIYSPHTALDACAGGITDWLCEGIAGLADASKGEPKAGELANIKGDSRALSPHQDSDPNQEVKLVTFVPTEAADHVRGALATAGAGLIGGYSVCSFSVPGRGTFLPGEGTHPAIGQPGSLESVDELRMEMVCSRAALPLAIETLRQFHPYEEPAIDVYQLVPLPRRTLGVGRRLVLDQPATVSEIAERLRGFLGRSRIKVALPAADHPIEKVAVVPGAGAEMLRLAHREGAQVFVTGEMKHHEILAALHMGVAVVLAGHTNTERGYLPRLAGHLERRLSGATVKISAVDRDPLEVLHED